MSSELWSSVFSSVQSMMISLFGFFFSVMGAAVETLLALIFLAALFRLVVRPLLGYAIDLQLSDVRRDMRAKHRFNRIGKQKSISRKYTDQVIKDNSRR